MTPPNSLKVLLLVFLHLLGTSVDAACTCNGHVTDRGQGECKTTYKVRTSDLPDLFMRKRIEKCTKNHKLSLQKSNNGYACWSVMNFVHKNRLLKVYFGVFHPSVVSSRKTIKLFVRKSGIIEKCRCFNRRRLLWKIVELGPMKNIFVWLIPLTRTTNK